VLPVVSDPALRRDVEAPLPAEPTVHVTIGRLEIRATAAARPAPARAPTEPRIASLDEYLEQRAERAR
jgi:hypothetical protein